jgi:hypothetical protein
MIICPNCKSHNLAKIAGCFGTPMHTISCKLCGAEFHSKYFWLWMPIAIFLPVFVLISYGIYPYLAVSIFIVLSIYFLLQKYDSPKITNNLEKYILYISYAFFAGYFVYDFFAK